MNHWIKLSKRQKFLFVLAQEVHRTISLILLDVSQRWIFGWWLMKIESNIIRKLLSWLFSCSIQFEHWSVSHYSPQKSQFLLTCQGVLGCPGDSQKPSADSDLWYVGVAHWLVFGTDILQEETATWNWLEEDAGDVFPDGHLCTTKWHPV